MFIAPSNEDKEESPWLATPTFSADPKMGTSIGAMGAYVFKADADSPSSMLGAMASYSSTDSTLLALFSRNYFGADSHRLVAGAAIGRIENDYSDFLGTGLHIKTTDELSGQAVRYSTRVLSDWFVGAQLVNMDYQITGSDAETQDYLESIGLTGFASTGVGIVTQRDTRDNQNSPRKGSEFKLNNIAYRESLGGDASFDVYDMSLQRFMRTAINTFWRLK